MKLCDEPRSIQEAIFQSAFVHLDKITTTDAYVRIGEERRIHFRLQDEQVKMDNVEVVSSVGPIFSSFLFNEAINIAFLNIKYEREKESKKHI